MKQVFSSCLFFKPFACTVFSEAPVSPKNNSNSTFCPQQQVWSLTEAVSQKKNPLCLYSASVSSTINMLRLYFAAGGRGRTSRVQAANAHRGGRRPDALMHLRVLTSIKGDNGQLCRAQRREKQKNEFRNSCGDATRCHLSSSQILPRTFCFCAATAIAAKSLCFGMLEGCQPQSEGDIAVRILKYTIHNTH